MASGDSADLSREFLEALWREGSATRHSDTAARRADVELLQDLEGVLSRMRPTETRSAFARGRHVVAYVTLAETAPGLRDVSVALQPFDRLWSRVRGLKLRVDGRLPDDRAVRIVPRVARTGRHGGVVFADLPAADYELGLALNQPARIRSRAEPESERVEPARAARFRAPEEEGRERLLLTGESASVVPGPAGRSEGASRDGLLGWSVRVADDGSGLELRFRARLPSGAPGRVAFAFERTADRSRQSEGSLPLRPSSEEGVFGARGTLGEVPRRCLLTYRVWMEGSTPLEG